MQRITVANSGQSIALYSGFHDRELARSVPGRQAYYENGKFVCWEYPLRPEALDGLRRVFPGAQVDPVVNAAINNVILRESMVSKIKTVGWENVGAINYSFKSKPFAHQVAAMKTVLTVWGFKDA